MGIDVYAGAQILGQSPDVDIMGRLGVRFVDVTAIGDNHVVVTLAH